MTTIGELNSNEEFLKAKRNLLWFCSFGFLLCLIEPAGDGLAIPLIGAGGLISKPWLQSVSLIAIVYAFVGYYFRLLEVERLHTPGIYGQSGKGIQQKLEQVGVRFKETQTLLEAKKAILDDIEVVGSRSVSRPILES